MDFIGDNGRDFLLRTGFKEVSETPFGIEIEGFFDLHVVPAKPRAFYVQTNVRTQFGKSEKITIVYDPGGRIWTKLDWVRLDIFPLRLENRTQHAHVLRYRNLRMPGPTVRPTVW